MPAGRITGNRTKIRETYGFFIGIDRYRDRKGIPPLAGCVRDAQRLCDAFTLQHKKIMKNREATRKNILSQIQWYMTNLKTRDLLVLTISAHGTIVNNDFAIVTYDSESGNLLGTALPTYYMLNALSEITKNGGKVLLILDACHAGAINFDVGKYSDILAGGGMSCLNSSGPNEVSYESVFTEGSRQVRQGVFTYYLLEGLQGGAQTAGLSMITLRDLYDYIYQNVCRHYQQHPVLIGTLEGSTILKY